MSSAARDIRGASVPLGVRAVAFAQVMPLRQSQQSRYVKPSAKPTLVRTQHLPPSNSQVRPGPLDRVSCVQGAVSETSRQ